MTILLIEHDMAFVMNFATSFMCSISASGSLTGSRPRSAAIPWSSTLISGARLHAERAQARGLYGPIRAVRGIDLDVEAGEIVALIGANGAGKTSTLRAIAGLLPFRGESPTRAARSFPTRPSSIFAPVFLVPEGRGMLGRMSVKDNLRMGIYARSDRAEAAADIERMFERFPILKERRPRWRTSLSGGEQQMLAIARACCRRPRLIDVR